MVAGSSRSFLNPELVSALKEGHTFEEWLDGRIPGVDYSRISGDHALRSSTRAKTREVGTGVRHQHEENAETAVEHGIAIVKFFEDNNITAADPEVVRPSFIDMTRSLHYRKTSEGYPVCAVISVEHERVWRLPEDYIKFRRAVIVKGDGLFIERRKPYDLASVGGNILGLVNSGVSEGEVTKTKERTERNLRRRAQDGTSPGGRRRFGWLAQDVREGRGMNMKLHPEESIILRHMIDKALEGRAWNSIARDLNEFGIVGASGKPWSGATVRQLLINPVLCGQRAVGGKLVLDKSGNPVMGKWETICTVEESEALRQLSVRRGAQAGGLRKTSPGLAVPGSPESRTRKYLFSGFLRCGAPRKDDPSKICNSKMGGNPRPTKAKPDNCVYVCARLDCAGTSRQMAPVDEFLEELIVRALEARYKMTQPKKVEWAGAAMLADVQARRSTLETKWAEGAVSDDSFYRLLPGLDEKIAGLEADRRDFLDEQAAKNAFSGWDRSKWKDMDLTQKRAAIGRIIHAVIVSPIPKGRSRSAPFDPDLLRVVPRS
ncbi:recombinase family protein [Streptomyces sp. NPDC014733]|uniref:recombinase family protein n=1 Tax=Streptomyces sp. NPDC014733 TaxID=3364885 RepID=UPI0036FB045C